MERTSNTNRIFLLPNFFRKIGAVIVLGGLASLIILKAKGVDLGGNAQLKFWSNTLLIAGLLFIALAKDKFEDERSLLLRTNCMAGGLAAAATYVIVSPLVDLVFGDPVTIPNGQQVVISVMVLFIIMFNIQKRL